jgi:hypothetical protein
MPWTTGPRGAGSIFIAIFDGQHRDCGFEGRNVGPDFLRPKISAIHIVRMRNGQRRAHPSRRSLDAHTVQLCKDTKQLATFGLGFCPRAAAKSVQNSTLSRMRFARTGLGRARCYGTQTPQQLKGAPNLWLRSLQGFPTFTRRFRVRPEPRALLAIFEIQWRGQNYSSARGRWPHEGEPCAFAELGHSDLRNG